MKIIDYIKVNTFSILLILTIFVSLFSVKAVSYLVFSLFLIWLFKFKNFDNFKSKFKLIIPFYIYCLVVFVSFFLAQDKGAAIKVLERHISFVLLPLMIFCKKWSKDDIIFFTIFFKVMVVSVVIFSILNLFYFYVTHTEFVNSMDDTYLQWKLPHLSGFHPTYFGFLIVVANIFLLKKIETKNFLKNTNFYIAVFLSLYLLYLSPRTSVICLLIVWLNFLYNWIKSKSYSKVYFIVLFGITIICLVLTFFSSKYLVDKFFKALTDQRFILWLEALQIIKENYFIFAEGLGSSIVLLDNYIKINELNQFKVSDLHNQYLMNYVDMGIFGFLALFYMCIKPIFKIKKRALSIFVLVFFISILTESFLFVIKGIVIFIILFSFLIIDSQKGVVKK